MLILGMVAIFSVYIVVVFSLYMIQRKLIYPGAGRICELNEQSGYQKVKIKTADGLNLTALYHAAAPGGRTMLFFHGNRNSAKSGISIVSPMIAAGNGALLMEYRGYCGNPGEVSEAGLIDDSKGAMAFLNSKGVTPGNIVVTGYSLGTGVAAHVAANYAVAGTVLIAPYTSIPDVANVHFTWVPNNWLISDRFDTIDRIKKGNGPLLLVHGGEDTMIPVSNSQGLAKLRPDATLKIIPNEGHMIAYSMELPPIIDKWVKQNIVAPKLASRILPAS